VENIYKMGRRKEAVFPLPVTALAITSFLSKIKGIANCYIGVGFVYP
jgi:energy-converting hydrogenase Eha subunit A